MQVKTTVELSITVTMGTEERGRCGEVAVMGRLGCNMTIFWGESTTRLLSQVHAYCIP